MRHLLIPTNNWHTMAGRRLRPGPMAAWPDRLQRKFVPRRPCVGGQFLSSHNPATVGPIRFAMEQVPPYQA